MSTKINAYKKLKTQNHYVSILTTGIQEKNNFLKNTYIKTNYVFEYILDGEGSIKIDKKSYNVKKGDLVLFPVHKVISFSANTSNPFTYWWIDFFGPAINYVLEQAGFNENTDVISFNNDKIPELMEKIHLEMNKNTLTGRLSALSIFFELLSLLVSLNHETTFEKGFVDVYIEKAIWYIQNYFSNDIKVKDIAKHINISEFYLTSIFTKHVGTSPIDYLINYRIEQAQNMLTIPNIPITLISQNCGFNSTSYFTMRFKNITGMTPKEFRKKTTTPPPLNNNNSTCKQKI